jgi:hypothetical protein
MKLKVKLTFSKNDYVQSKNNYQGRSYPKMKLWCQEIARMQDFATFTPDPLP